MKCELWIDIRVMDRNGNIVKRISRKSDSFVANFARILRGLAVGNCTTATGVQSSTTVKDLNGNNASACTGSGSGLRPINLNAGAGDDSYGIVVGSGTDPVSYDDYKMSNKIPDSVLHYTAMTISDVEEYGTYAIIKLSRIFQNNGSSDVTVTETGIIADNRIGSESLVKFLIARDVLSSPITVKPGGSLNVTYTLKVSL